MAVKYKPYGFRQKKGIVNPNGFEPNLHGFKGFDHLNQRAAPFMRYML